MSDVRGRRVGEPVRVQRLFFKSTQVDGTNRTKRVSEYSMRWPVLMDGAEERRSVLQNSLKARVARRTVGTPFCASRLVSDVSRYSLRSNCRLGVPASDINRHA